MSAKTVLFIDSRVAGYETLIASLDTDTQWHVLDPQHDGIAQIERLLADASDLDAIQIISHGAPGTLYLGSTVLTGSNLPEHAQRLQSIGATLTATGDLLLYGCNVAEGEVGQAFVNALAALTGADVAASDDITGPANLGGNSVLEQVVGKIDTLNISMESLPTSLADDHSDSRTGATALALGTAASGTIGIVSDKDYFKVDLVAGQRYLFEMNGAGLNALDTAYLNLYGPTGSYIDSGYGRDLATFSYVPTTTGTYYLEASELGDDSVGSYTVKASVATVADDHSDSRTGATALTLGAAASGTIEIVSDKDYFKVDLIAGQRYLFEMNGAGLNALDTAYLYLYGPTGSYIESGYDRDLASFSYVPTTTGTYYLEVSELGDDSVGSYTVKASIATVADDHSDSRTGATALTLGAAASGTIEIVSDKDYFKVDLVTGQRYLFEMNGAGLNALDTAYLNLYSPTGSYIESGYDRDLASFSYVPTTTGTYYLEASELGDDSVGSYTVKASIATVADDHSDSRTGATALALGTAASGTIGIVSDKDYFKVDLVAGQRYLFEMNGAGLNALDTAYLYLYGPTGSYIESGYDRDLASFSYIPTTTGTYYLEASELGDDSVGSYAVKASIATVADDHSDSRTGATALTLGAAASGTIEIVSDKDYFKVDLVAGQRYLFEMNGAGLNALDTAYLNLYGPTGSYIESGYGRDLATFSYVPTATGTYYLEASELGDDSVGSYSVKVSNPQENSTPTGYVSISGIFIQGQTLNATNTLADADGLGTINYQWKANATAITGATGLSYTLTQAEVGKAITVTASYTDGRGTAESKTSAAAATVANVNDAPTGTVTISGVIAVGQTLTAANTLADVDGLGTISYQWNANGAAITGATGSTYTLTQAEVNKTITVTASYTDGYGTPESKTSAATVPVAVTGSTPVEGTPGNDTLAVPIGSAKVDAGAGIDTVLLPLFPNAFKLNPGQTGQAQGSFGRGHRLELNDVEYVQFGSSAFKTKLDLSDLVSGMAQEQLGQLTDLYLAFFGRAPDVNGLEYWQQQLLDSDLKAQGKNKNLTQMAKDFAWGDEAQKLFPIDASNRDFVRVVYQNCFGRDPDQAGWDYWTGVLDSRGSTDLSARGAFVADVILGAYAPSSGAADRNLLTNKHNVAMYYVNQLSEQPQEGYDVAINALLAKLTADSATQGKAEKVIDHAFANPVSLAGVMSDAALFDSLWV